MNKLKIQAKNFTQSTLMFPVIITAALIIINWILQPNLFSAYVFRTNIMTFSPLILVAIGQAIIMVSGYMDLSVGYGVSLINVILASYMNDSNSHNTVVIFIALGAAVAMGIANGLLVGFLNVPAFIGTFSSSFVWLGIAIMVRPQPGGYIPKSFINFFKMHAGPFPMMLAVVIIAVTCWLIIRRYKLGRYIYAMGSNKNAAYCNGINVKKVTLLSFSIGWVFVFLGALALTSQTRSGDARVGDPFALNSIAAAIVGGVSMSGGIGSPLGAVLGAITLSIIMNIIYFAGIPNSLQVLVKGVIIIVALGAAVLYKKDEE